MQVLAARRARVVQMMPRAIPSQSMMTDTVSPERPPHTFPESR